MAKALVGAVVNERARRYPGWQGSDATMLTAEIAALRRREQELLTERVALLEAAARSDQAGEVGQVAVEAAQNDEAGQEQVLFAERAYLGSQAAEGAVVELILVR